MKMNEMHKGFLTNSQTRTEKSWKLILNTCRPKLHTSYWNLTIGIKLVHEREWSGDKNDRALGDIA